MTNGLCSSGSCEVVSNCIVIDVATSPTSTGSETPTTCFDGSDGSATISVSGGLMPYTYLWSDGQTSATATNLSTGSYSVTATTADGCTTTETITVTSLSSGLPCFGIGVVRN